MAQLLQQFLDYTDRFTFEPGVTPMTTVLEISSMIFIYHFAVRLLKSRKKEIAIPVAIPAVHNLFLSVASAVILMGCLYESIKESKRVGSVFWMICLSKGTPMQGGLYFWSYMYYLSKYVEFIDTLLLAAKNKPIGFLHIFHHTLVVPMAYLWLYDAQSSQQLGLMVNCFIHIIMYYYYFLCSIKIYPKWKKLITNSQIVQFVFSFLVTLPFWYPAIVHGQCSGLNAMIFNALFNAALLALFIDFHRRTYLAEKQRRAAAAAAAAKKES